MLNPWFKRTHPLKDIKKRLAWHAITGRALSRAAGIFYLCEEERRLALSNFSIKPRSEAITPLGTPPLTGDRELFFREYPFLVGKRILMFLGRICYMKGCDILLDAFARSSQIAPDVHLVMCGPDQHGWRKDLERRSSELGIQDRVTWTGPLYGSRKLAALAAADLFVLPSRCETFPIAVLEALASSTPVLVTRDINIYPAIESSQAGLICDSSAESVAEALAAWFGKTAEEQLDYRRRARECHALYFTLEHAIDAHIAEIRAQIKTMQEGELCRLSA
jgi:glycosyltransferase involved in cell wall biosynthesis